MGMSTIFLDGNYRNHTPENMMIVSIQELRAFHKAGHQKLTSDYTRAVFLKQRLENRIKEMEEEK